MATCVFVKSNGGRCKSPALRGSKLCLFHDPAKEADRKAARSRGGSKNRPSALPCDTALIELRTREALIVLVEATLNDVRCGRVHPRIANAIGILVGLQMRLLEPTDGIER